MLNRLLGDYCATTATAPRLMTFRVASAESADIVAVHSFFLSLLRAQRYLSESRCSDESLSERWFRNWRWVKWMEPMPVPMRFTTNLPPVESRSLHYAPTPNLAQIKTETGKNRKKRKNEKKKLEKENHPNLLTQTPLSVSLFTSAFVIAYPLSSFRSDDRLVGVVCLTSVHSLAHAFPHSTSVAHSLTWSPACYVFWILWNAYFKYK